jgi:predicted esterase
MNSIRIESGRPPHTGQRLHVMGAPLDAARGACLMIHGRGATAESILALAEEFPHAELAYVAPQAAGNTWYPQSFLRPIESNEPALSSALALVDAVVAELVEVGIPHEKIILLGFSQGACLATEYAARHARRYGGVVAFSGGLIGPEGTPRNYEGDFAGTPVFLGCSDIDSHIPLARVEETAAVFERMGAAVTKRIYPGMGHTVNRDEVDFVRELIQRL